MNETTDRLDSYTEDLIAAAFTPDELGRTSPLKVSYSSHAGHQLPPVRNLTDADSVRRIVCQGEAVSYRVAVSYDTEDAK